MVPAVVKLLQEIGSYAGFAAVFGLAILSTLYFSQARDVKRLREWAGRAPERAEAADEVVGAAVQAVPVAARPLQGVPSAQPAAGDGEQAAAEGAAAPAAGAAAAGAAAAGAAAVDQAADAGQDTADQEEVAAAQEVAASANGEDAAEPAAAPAAATPAGAAARTGAAPAVASAAGTTTPAAPGTAAGTAVAGGGGPAGDTQTGAKVLPAKRPVPPVRPRPTIPARPAGQAAVLATPPGSRPPASRLPAPRYIALIVAGIVVLGLGGTVGVMQLTKNDNKSSPTEKPPATDIGDPTRSPDKPEPARVDPSTVTVAVLNGTNVTGLATRISSRLQSAGFVPGNTQNAADQQRAESVVMFKPGASAAARAVARKLGISQIEPIDAQSQGLSGDAKVVVVVGADKSNG